MSSDVFIVLQFGKIGHVHKDVPYVPCEVMNLLQAEVPLTIRLPIFFYIK